MSTPRNALERLLESAEAGELDGFFFDHGVELMTAFWKCDQGRRIGR